MSPVLETSQLRVPRCLDQQTQRLGAALQALTVKIPAGCEGLWAEVESQDVLVSWFATPRSDGRLPGRNTLAPAGLVNMYRWSADTSPAGGKARFPILDPKAVTVTVQAQQQFLPATAFDPLFGIPLNGTTAAPMATLRIWDGDPYAVALSEPPVTVFNGLGNQSNLPQTGAGASTDFGFAPGYCRYARGFANNGCQWQLSDANAAFLIANVVNQSFAFTVSPFALVRLFNGGGAATQGQLSWSTLPQSS